MAMADISSANIFISLHLCTVTCMASFDHYNKPVKRKACIYCQNHLHSFDDKTDPQHWQIIITQNSWFTLGSTLGVIYSMGLSKYIVTCICHKNVMQSFTALKILCALWIYPSLPQPMTTNVFFTNYSFAFSRMSYGWDHTVYSHFILASFTY